MSTEGRGCIVAFAPGDWRYPGVYGSTRYHLWTLASLGWAVVYIEPATRFHFGDDIWRADDRPFWAVKPGWSLPFAPRMSVGGRAGELWRAAAARGLWNCAGRVLGRIGQRGGIVWLGSPWHSPISRLAGSSYRQVTFVYDELSESPALSEARRPRLWKWELELLAGVELAICSSRPQADRRAPHVPKTLVVENAIPDGYTDIRDEDLGEAGRGLIRKLEDIPSPRAAYGGVVDLRLDADLFREVMESLPGLHLVMLGQLSPHLDPDFRRYLETHPRIHLFGYVPHACYPALYGRCDVLLLGHRRSGFTDAMFPEKLNEYLASGRPIVSVALPEVVRVVHESGEERLVYVSENRAKFVESVGIALSERDEELCALRKRDGGRRTFGRAAERIDEELQVLFASSGVYPR